MSTIENARPLPDLEEIVRSIAAEHGVTIEIQSGCRARAWRNVSTIRIRLIRNMETYATALHEIGHCVANKQSRLTRLEKEYSAWIWALQHSPIPFDSSAWLCLNRSLRSYVTWAETRQHRRKVRPVIPDRTHPMWKLLAQAKENF